MNKIKVINKSVPFIIINRETHQDGQQLNYQKKTRRVEKNVYRTQIINVNQRISRLQFSF